MATHDYNIANQGFPAFRADLNDALAAIVSNNSNATAPATTFAHMLWVDTAANPSVLKIRNADNDAWVTIGSINQTDDKFKLTPADGVSTDTISELTSAAGVTIDGVLLKDSEVTTDVIKEKTSGTGVTVDSVLLKDGMVGIGADGSASAPSIYRASDTNTGIFFPAADNIGFAAGGTIRGRWTTDGLCFGSDTAAANALDDYEEGTWTATVFDAGSGGNQSSTTSTGHYTKIGDMVFFSFNLEDVSTAGMTAGSAARFTLPFATSGTLPKNNCALAHVLYRDLNWATGTQLTSWIPNSESRMYFFTAGDNVNYATLKVSEINSGTADFLVSGQFRV